MLALCNEYDELKELLAPDGINRKKQDIYILSSQENIDNFINAVKDHNDAEVERLLKQGANPN